MENRTSIGGVTGVGLLLGISIIGKDGEPDSKLADQLLYK